MSRAKRFLLDELPDARSRIQGLGGTNARFQTICDEYDDVDSRIAEAQGGKLHDLERLRARRSALQRELIALVE